MPAMPTPAPHKGHVLPVACIVVLLALATVVEFWPSSGIKSYAVRAKPELILGRDKITTRNAAYLRMGLLKMSNTFCEPHELAADSKTAIALYGQPCPAPDPAVLHRDMPPSTALLPPTSDSIPEGVTVVSLVCRADHLFGEDHGIVTHPHDTGTSSERPAWISARLGSQLLLESTIALRIHGGFSRQTPHKSFSLNFRENYGGYPKCPPGLFFGPDTPAASRIVLMNAHVPGKFKGALGTEIAAALGCNTSRLTPAVVYLNGTLIKSPFFLYQHQSEDFVKDRFAIKDVDWVRLKAEDRRESDEFIRWRQWIRKDRFPTLLEDEAKRYDIEDLNNWALAISFLSSGDNDQGGYFRDLKATPSIWHSLVWDLDCAFTQGPKPDYAVPYMDANDPFPWLQGNRSRLFLRLMERTPEYRALFRQHVQKSFTERLPKEKLTALAERYVQLARAHPGTYDHLIIRMEEARDFLQTRHEVYLAYLERRLKELEATHPAATLRPAK